MTSPRRRLLAALLLLAVGTALALGVFAALGLALSWSTMAAFERASLAAVLAPRLPLWVMAALSVVLAVVALALPALRRRILAPWRLLEHAQVLVSNPAGPLPPPAPGAPPPLDALMRVVEHLAQQREALRADMARQVAAASADHLQARNRLAALIGELAQGVVVCALDGRVLLYNARARLQLKALSSAPAAAGGADLIGLGRSIYAVFDRERVAHALDTVQRRAARGAAHPRTRFIVGTRSGQLLRVQLAPVCEAATPSPRDGPAAAPGPDAISGFVLVFENITREHRLHAEAERLLHAADAAQRAALVRQSAAIDTLADPACDAAARAEALGRLRAEVDAMRRGLDDGAAHAAALEAARWPLEPMRGADFVAVVQRRLDAEGLRVAAEDVDSALWLRLDSFAMLQAVVGLARRVRVELGVATGVLRLAAGDPRQAWLDLAWPGVALSQEVAIGWTLDPIAAAPAAAAATSLRELMRRHGGELRFERDRVRQQALFRFVLPLADGGSEHADDDAAPRPALLGGFEPIATPSTAGDDRRLDSLAFTVFDTETTGLDLAAGDEIIQLGAVRVLGGRVLADECFDQLVKPRRRIGAGSIAIHGITPDRVADQPPIEQVLPAFHAFAVDTVLVAHNAAFDMRLLQLQQPATGLRFDQPVLDTLLLSAAVHPNQASHRLEAIAERLGVPVSSRHSALGDARTTAAILVRLIPLLAARGIVTLSQAQEASRRTPLSRLRY